MKLVTATYNRATYTYQHRMREVVITHPSLSYELRMPVPALQDIGAIWSEVREPLRVFWTQVLGYDFVTDYLQVCR